ncbi:HAMP domain-containing protein [Methanocella sp. MCL-LM]|uniref:HAMP domain-containing protein n=1 Tax=Methanocella sp. MCL-LM TaxID=3412035 RepID=UPI003C786DF8
MTKIYNSLVTKLTVSFILLILIVSSMTFFYTYNETKNALKERMQDELQSVAGVAATQINSTAVAALKPGDETTAAFTQIRDQLEAMRAINPDIKYIYIMRKNGEAVEFAVDADYGTDADAAKIGDLYEANSELLAGFSGLSADKEFTTDEWGTVLSGYAPIKDGSGNVVGIVGVDMASDRVIQQQEFIGNTIYVIIGISVLIAAAIVGYFVATIMRDINKLNRQAEKVSKGDMDVVVDVNRRDEVGDLAESFSRMVASIKFERMMREEEAAHKTETAPEIKS